MSVPPNIDRFNKVVLLVFDQLYESFPVPIDIDASKIAMDTLPPGATFDDSFQSIEPISYALEFLKKEGFIEGEQTIDGSTLFHARLTSKSLALLGQPSVLEPHVTISDKIKSVLKGGIKEVSSEAAKKAVEVVFTHGASMLALGQAAVHAAS